MNNYILFKDIFFNYFVNDYEKNCFAEYSNE